MMRGRAIPMRVGDTDAGDTDAREVIPMRGWVIPMRGPMRGWVIPMRG